MAAPARVSLCVGSRVHVRVSSPAVVQLGVLVCVHSPHWWVWAGVVGLFAGGKEKPDYRYNGDNA